MAKAFVLYYFIKSTSNNKYFLIKSIRVALLNNKIITVYTSEE